MDVKFKKKIRVKQELLFSNLVLQHKNTIFSSEANV